MTFGRRTRRTQASGNGTQFTVFVDVASAVRRDARDDFEDGHALYTSGRNGAWSIPPSYRSSFDSGKTPAPSYDDHEGVTRSFGSLAPSYYTNPIELPSPAHLTPSHH
ncbi:hypothetical protein PENSPDRAFT_272826 [Peniophora sp. CONT]|nr:hypothetical protein PENSPDRAFT_272826 [Peniophora sp. CONT]